MTVVFIYITMTMASISAGFLHAMPACPTLCACRWKGGKETVDCVSRSLTNVPHGMGANTQVLDLSRNNLRQLPREVFLLAGVLNLQKIYLSHCKLERIDNSAFSNLHNLVELDLSSNLLVSVPTETFVDYVGLRRLVLSENSIRRIEMDAFLGLPTLSNLELSSCNIEMVAVRAFDGLKSLVQLKLDNNRLTHIPAEAMTSLKSLQGVELHGNPWTCDCHLKDFKKWLVRNGIPHTTSPICSTPTRLAGMPLDQLGTEDFACVPEGLPSNHHPRAKERGVATLICRVYSEPESKMIWYRKGKVLLNNSDNQYFIKETGGSKKSSTLTLNSVAIEDSGWYMCRGENMAGSFVTNFTLVVEEQPIEPPSRFGAGHVIGVLTVVVVICLVVLVLLLIKKLKLRPAITSDFKDNSAHSNHKKFEKSLGSTNHTNYDSIKEKQELKAFTTVAENKGSNYSSVHESEPRVEPDEPKPVTNKPDVVNVDCNMQPAPANDKSYQNYKENLLDEIESELHQLVEPKRRSEVVIKETGPFMNGVPGRHATLQYIHEAPKCNGRVLPLDPISKEEYADEQYRQRHDILPELRHKMATGNMWQRNTMAGSSYESSTLPRFRVKPYQQQQESDTESLINIKTNFVNDPTLQNPTPIFMERENSFPTDLYYKTYEGDVIPNSLQRIPEWHESELDYQMDYPLPVPSGRKGPPPPVPPRSNSSGVYLNNSLYSDLSMNAKNVGLVSSARLKGMVAVLPPLPNRHFGRMRKSPDEGFDDEGEEALYIQH